MILRVALVEKRALRAICCRMLGRRRARVAELVRRVVEGLVRERRSWLCRSRPVRAKEAIVGAVPWCVIGELGM
jgi:hypothetical protein